MKSLNKLKEERPELLTNPDVFQLAEQADMVQDLKILHDSEGGKQLTKLLFQDAVGCVNRLRGGYHKMSHMELVAIIAQMDTHIAVAHLLLDAKGLSESLNAELEEALRE
jgi:hypothetical protein